MLKIIKQQKKKAQSESILNGTDLDVIITSTNYYLTAVDASGNESGPSNVYEGKAIEQHNGFESFESVISHIKLKYNKKRVCHLRVVY